MIYVKHKTQCAGVNDPSKQISKDAWNEDHDVTGIFDAVYPVGSVYLAMVNVAPSTLFGGTWAALGAGFALVTVDAADAAIDAAGKTAGANTATPAGAVSQPTFAGTQASLTHSGAAVSAHAGAAVADHASHTHQYTQVPNHVHVQRLQGGTTGATTGTHLMGSTATGGSLRSSAQSTLDPTGGVAAGTTAGPSATLTHAVTQPSDHVVTQPSAHSYTPAGTVSQPTFTGQALSVRQKSLALYAWQRTA